MTVESLMKLAEAAGFAMASDENEQTVRVARSAAFAHQTTLLPKDVLNFGRNLDEVRGLRLSRARAPLAGFLPSWYAAKL